MTDETSAIVSEYKDRLTYISEKDRGQSHAINKGFRMARGEIVSWLNSDDIILPRRRVSGGGAILTSTFTWSRVRRRLPRNRLYTQVYGVSS